jgi:RimJ/RimL family protein N-acetyltransferase
MWGNWAVRVRAAGTVAGTVQATLPAGGPFAGPAEVAWVVVGPAQGRGYATEAARSLVALLQAVGWTVVAHIDPGHLASQWVARRAGLSPTVDVRDAEIAGSALRLRHHNHRPCATSATKDMSEPQ